MNNKQQIYGVNLEHGQKIKYLDIENTLTNKRNGAYVGWGSLMILEPNTEKFQTCCCFIDKTNFIREYEHTKILSRCDEILLAKIHVGENWTHVDPRYHIIPWKKYAHDVHNIVGIHFHGKKKLQSYILSHEFEQQQHQQQQRQQSNPELWPDVAYWWHIFQITCKEFQLYCIRENFHHKINHNHMRK